LECRKSANGNPNLSFDSWTDYNNRQTFGSDYYNLPGHQNPVQEALGQYLAQVDRAFAEANAAPANDGTAACIANGLQSTFSGSSITAGASTGEVGGHWNFYVTVEFASQSAFNAFNSTWVSWSCWARGR